MKFGIEFEFFGQNRSYIAQRLKENNINVIITGDYSSNDYDKINYWQLKTDVSVTPDDCENYETVYEDGEDIQVESEGNELVSPILNETNFNELETVFNTLNNSKIKIDNTCGLHVHHDINDFTLKDIKNLYKYIYKSQKLFNKMMPANRKDNHYARLISRWDMDMIGKAKNIGDILDYLDRYKTINIQSYAKYGTIEFRQHEGTMNFTETKNWILFTNSILSIVRNMRNKKRCTVKKTSNKAKFCRYISERMLKEAC